MANDDKETGLDIDTLNKVPIPTKDEDDALDYESVGRDIVDEALDFNNPYNSYED